jgi:glycosyltransferase involved in cell wall biosynthesis
VNHGLDFVVAPSHAPSVVTIHDLSFLVVPQYAHPRLRAYLASAVPRTLQRVAAVITVSEQVRHEIAAFYGISADRIVAIPHGVEPRFRPPSAAAIAATLSRHNITIPYFLTVGTIEPRKNHQTLLAAFTAVAAVDPAVQLVVVGRPGWLYRGIVQQLQVWERRGRVKWLHALADDDLPALYAGCVALVYPSWYEGFGFPVLEAMACGAPVIASDLPVLRDVAGEAAMYVPASDAEALGAAMQRLLTDQPLRERLRMAGLTRAQQFTWEASATKHLAVYRAVAEMRR